MASQIPGAKVVRLPESPDYAPEFSHPERNLKAARTFVADLRDQEAELDRVLATVLFTDMVDSTAIAAAMGDRAWRDVSNGTARSFGASWAATAAPRSTPSATDSSRPLTGRRVPSAAPSSSSMPSAP